MALYQETFTIINNSQYTLVLDVSGSSNLGDGDWPATVAPRTTSNSFLQTGNFSVNPTAVYQCQGANPPVNIYMHFYCAGLVPFVHVNMTMTFGGSSPFPGSCINESNSKETQTVCTPSALSISTTDNGTSQGQANFTVGTP